MQGDTDEAGSCGCKVGRSAARYDLDALDEELLAARREQGASLRDLTSMVNAHVLEAALSDADASEFDLLDGEDVVEGLYDALTGEDEARRARVETRLRQAGVDVEAVRSRWVTHPTVRTHLRKCLGVSTSSSGTVDAEGAIDTVEWARARCASVIERTMVRLASADVVEAGDLDVAVTVRITCNECDTSFSPRELIAEGSCGCESSEE